MYILFCVTPVTYLLTYCLITFNMHSSENHTLPRLSCDRRAFQKFSPIRKNLRLTRNSPVRPEFLDENVLMKICRKAKDRCNFVTLFKHKSINHLPSDYVFHWKRLKFSEVWVIYMLWVSGLNFWSYEKKKYNFT